MKLRISWRGHKAPFQYPLGPAPRTAVLGPWFRETGQVRMFRSGWTPEVQTFAPEVIVATWPQLWELSQSFMAAPARAVIVVTAPGTPLLSPADREALWRAFHVPVFEQIIGVRGKLLAAECEAHDGLHIEGEGVAVLGSALDESPCPCGLKTPRLAPARRTVSAYAR